MRGRLWILVMVAVVFLLWNTPVMLPLKILVVFFHELSHGLAAVLSGGRVESISLSPQQGGLAVTRGGSGFLITSAGYIGSLLIGVLVFLLAVRGRTDRAVMALLGGVLLLVAALYMRETFALLFSVAAGLAMLGSARYFNARVNDGALRVIGLTSMVYVPFDILSDTILRSSERSDAYNLAQQFGGTAWLWGGVWLVISLVVIWWALRKGLRL
ncbi:MAG: M50 family metallopeptidase [Rhodobacteraceae bacterium]|nr:M50 family metallopeptidase [Paracoccaceae bacterium]